MSESNTVKASLSTALVKVTDSTAESVIFRARVHSQRPEEPVWAPPVIAIKPAGSLSPVRQDAVALALKLEQFIGHDPSLVVLSSLRTMAGVSTAAVELARTVARTSGEPVLLIDANMRRSSLSERLSIPEGPGLCEAVRGEVSVHDAIAEIEPGSLYAMSTGESGDDAVTTLASSNCVALLASLRLQFAHIFIDTPPLGEFIDGIFLAAQAQYVTLFVEQGKHRRAEVAEILRELNAVGAKDVGLCLTKTRPT